MNRTLASCVKIVTDGDGSSIPHCAAVSLLRRELQEVAGVVEVAWMQAVLHNFPKTPAAGLFRGGDIAQAGQAANKVVELAAVAGRKALVYHGNHQCRALGTEEALDSSVRGPLELYRACTDGEAVAEEDVSYGMADLVGRVLDNLVEAREGRETDNDNRRYAELIEATDQGHAQAREKALEVALEIRGKATRSKDDCAAGGNASWTGRSQGVNEEEAGAAKRAAEAAHAAAPEGEKAKTAQALGAATNRLELAKTAKKRRSTGGKIARGRPPSMGKRSQSARVCGKAGRRRRPPRERRCASGLRTAPAGRGRPPSMGKRSQSVR
ncbi:unnamed protein product, partial [Ectocarpus sp. 8 AP-2014]